MNIFATRLRLLREALATDREGPEAHRRLERELSGYRSPADRVEIETIVSRFGADEAREVQLILDRQAA